MKLINADALLKKTINNPLHVPYITKKDVIDMPSALNNQVNLCDSCTYTYPECPSEKDDVIFGNGIGNDNICACNKYQPTVQPVATDTNVGDTISRRAAIRWVKTECNPYGKPTLEFESGKKVIEHLEQMPPAQPEPQWISVSERLPEKGGEYLVSVRWYREDDIDIDVYDYDARCKEWNDGESCGQRVIAWMPLPEVYKPNKK